MNKVIPQSLKVFLDKIIDYAGTYPPASLDLKTAFNNYLGYIKNSPYSWMLARFVCAASKLEELDEIIRKDKISIETPVSFSIVGTSGIHSSEFLDSVSHDADLIKSFLYKYDKLVTIGAYEVRLPGDVFSMQADKVLPEMIKRTAEVFTNISNKPISLFFESKPDENLPALAEAIASFNKSGGKAGYKLRTGGVESSAFPVPEKIAFALKTCLDFHIPMKCTAGLHHPIRHYNESVKTKMYGFINVFSAGVLHCCYNLNRDNLIEILTDEDAGNFIFSDSAFHWKNFYIMLSKVEEARKDLMLSFGSCSFDEPVDDLKKLNLL